MLELAEDLMTVAPEEVSVLFMFAITAQLTYKFMIVFIIFKSFLLCYAE